MSRPSIGGMFTSENDSRLANAVCETSIPTCRPSHKRLRRNSCTNYDDSGLKPTNGDASPSCKTVADERRRHFSRTGSISNSTISSSPSSKNNARRKRKKKHKHHHRHRSNRANDVYQDVNALPTPPKPTVNPIFVWIKQDDTRIVQVLCEDYDLRNRIRLTKTATGWRSIPLTESLERQWHALSSCNSAPAAKSLLVNDLSSTDNPQQTDNLSSSSQVQAPNKDIKPRSSEEPRGTRHSTLPLNAFDSDESNQEDLRSIIDKVQTDTLYLDDDYTPDDYRGCTPSCDPNDNKPDSSEANNRVEKTDNHVPNSCHQMSPAFGGCDTEGDQSNDSYLGETTHEQDPLAVSTNVNSMPAAEISRVNEKPDWRDSIVEIPSVNPEQNLRGPDAELSPANAEHNSGSSVLESAFMNPKHNPDNSMDVVLSVNTEHSSKDSIAKVPPINAEGNSDSFVVKIPSANSKQNLVVSLTEHRRNDFIWRELPPTKNEVSKFENLLTGNVALPVHQLTIKAEQMENLSSSVRTTKPAASDLSLEERLSSLQNIDHSRENHIRQADVTDGATQYTVSTNPVINIKSVDLYKRNKSDCVVSNKGPTGDVSSSSESATTGDVEKVTTALKTSNVGTLNNTELIRNFSVVETKTASVEQEATETSKTQVFNSVTENHSAIVQPSHKVMQNDPRCGKTANANSAAVGSQECISETQVVVGARLLTSHVIQSDKDTSNYCMNSHTYQPIEVNQKQCLRLQKQIHLQHPDHLTDNLVPVVIKDEKHDLGYECDSHHESSGALQLLRTPLCQTLKSNKLPSLCRRSQLISKKSPHFKNEPLPAHMHSISLQPIEIGHDLSCNNQDEPLDLGTGCRMKLAHTEKKVEPVSVKVPTSPIISPPVCRKRPSVEKDINDRQAVKKSRLLDLLTTKNSPAFHSQEGTNSDPLEQLKNVLANPKYSVPDPLLVPKARLSALVTCPGKEIPRLLAHRAQDLSYFSILSDPDVLVVSLSHLQSLLKKPINEEEILKYQKQTEEIRSRMRQECFNNNYENMALGNWNQCYWLPSFQRSDVIASCDPAMSSDLLSVLNIGFPPSATSCCRDDSSALPSTPNSAFDYHKRLEYQKEAALWQELAALHQLSTSSPFDQFNNNSIPSNCDLGKDVCDLMWNHQDLCTNYRCYQSPNTPPARTNSNPAKTKVNAAKCYPCDGQTSKLSIPFLQPMQYTAQPFELPEQPHSFDPLMTEYYSSPNLDNSFEYSMSGQDTKYLDPYDSLRQLLSSSSENADILQHLKMQQQQQQSQSPQQQKHPSQQQQEHHQQQQSHHHHHHQHQQTFVEEKPQVKEERDSRTLQNGRSKELKPETKQIHPLVPKIKVRKHLIDPNQRPTRLLNTDSHIFHNPPFPMASATTINGGSHLWHPLFNSNVERNYKKLQWTTPATPNGR